MGRMNRMELFQSGNYWDFFQPSDYLSSLENAVYDPSFCDEPPTSSPSPSPTISPTSSPTELPTKPPTTNPTSSPSSGPSSSPTMPPTSSPTESPTKPPTTNPTVSPSSSPTMSPTRNSTKSPTANPTKVPSLQPTSSPTQRPTPGEKCKGLGKHDCKKLKNVCTYSGKKKVWGDCEAKKAADELDCNQFTSETTCDSVDNKGLCSWMNGVCSHLCDNHSRQSCRRVKLKKGNKNKKICTTPRVKNPCFGCHSKD